MPSRDPHTSFTFDDAARSGGSHAVAGSVVAHASRATSTGGLVIVLDPAREHQQVVAGGVESALRAAVSSTAASGHTGFWDHAPEGDTAMADLAAVPDVLRAAVDGVGVVTAHVGAVRRDGQIRCAAIWFDAGAGVASPEDRRQTLQLLEAAVDRDLQHARHHAKDHQSAAEHDAAVADDIDCDPLAELLDLDDFIEALGEFDGDEAVLALIDVDDFDNIRSTYGDPAADAVLRTLAQRLDGSTRGSDVVARLDDHQFGVLFGQANRNAAMTIVKRLRDGITEPIDAAGEPLVATATIAFAHQHGLLDLDELFESAGHALVASRRAGPGRLVLAT